MVFIKLLMICTIWIIIIDYTDIIHHIERFFEKTLHIRKAELPKPFSCSMCMLFWSGLILLIMSGEFSLINLFLLLVLCFFNTTIYNVLYLIKDSIDSGLNYLINKLR